MLFLYTPLKFETIKVNLFVYMCLKLSNLMELSLNGDYFK